MSSAINSSRATHHTNISFPGNPVRSRDASRLTISRCQIISTSILSVKQHLAEVTLIEILREDDAAHTLALKTLRNGNYLTYDTPPFHRTCCELPVTRIRSVTALGTPPRAMWSPRDYKKRSGQSGSSSFDCHLDNTLALLRTLPDAAERDGNGAEYHLRFQLYL